MSEDDQQDQYYNGQQYVQPQQQQVEQIEATFGPMSAFVSGGDREEVLETFKEVWGELTETREEVKEDSDEGEDSGNGSNRPSSFG